MDENNRELEIDLRKILEMLKKKAIYIIIITLIGGIIAGCFTNFFISPKYTATAKLYAWSENDNVIGSSSSVTQSQIDAAKTLVNTYLVAVNSDTLLEKVADELGNDVSANQLKSMMSCSQIDETIAFQISVTHTNPKMAAKIVNTIADTCPEIIVKILKVGGVEIIDHAKVPTTPSSPNLNKNIAIGAVAGFVISFALFFLREILDTSIKDEDDLTREFEIPILGTVPKLIPVSDRESKSNNTFDDDLLSDGTVSVTDNDDSSNDDGTFTALDFDKLFPPVPSKDEEKDDKETDTEKEAEKEDK